MREVWRYYFSSIEGIIFVVDSTRTDRMMEVREELWKILSDDQAKRLPCLIYANKQDLPGAIPSEQLINELDLMRDNTMHNVNSLIHV